MNAETASPSPVAYGSPGEAIRVARERARLSLDELAARTRLSRQVLEALEKDAFEQLLEPVYVRGYYRKCAKVLDLAEQPLLDAYQSMYTPPPTVAPQRLRLASGGELGESSRLPKSFAVIAAFSAIVICGAIWLVRTARNSTPPTSPVTVLDQNGVIVQSVPLDGAAQAASTIGGAPTAMGSAISDTTTTAPETASAPTTTDSVPSTGGTAPAATQAVDPAAAAAAAAATDLAAASTSTTLTLQFNAISWARVEDRTGKSLLSGVISAGESRTLDGQPPYSVFLGNAPGVTVQFKGMTMDIKPFVKDNSTARFSVPVQGG